MMMLVLLLMIMVVFMIMAAALLIVVVMMMLVLLLMIMVVFMIVAAAFLVILFFLMGLQQLLQLHLQGVLLLHGCQNLLAVQLIPGRRDDGRIGVLLPQQRDNRRQLLLAHIICTAEDQGAGKLDLIVIELAEILHIHFALVRIGYRCKSVQLCALRLGILYGADHIAQLSHAGGFDQNAVRVELVQHLMQSLPKVTNQAAADAAGVHLGNIDAGILQKAAVNSDLAEFIFNQNQLLPSISLFDQLFNQGCFTGTQKTGENINFCHHSHLSFSIHHRAHSVVR